jgi:UPF0755 protein
MYSHGKSKKRTVLWRAVAVGVMVFILIALVGSVYAARRWYNESLQPVSTSSEVKKITITKGASLQEIAKLLESEQVIRSAKVFEAYVRTKDLSSELKAGVFELSPSWSLSEIVDVLVSGEEASDLFTIGPGLRLDQIQKRLQKAGFSDSDIAAALDPKQYDGHPALVGKPLEASLEGYIYPESFKITAASTANEIVRQSLDQLADKLTPDIIKAFAEQGLTTHEALIIASIIEKEVSGYEDRQKVAQVMLKRLREGMALGADATYLYAAAVYGGDPFPNNPSPYNTRLYTGLPPGPISNVGLTSLEAVANPSATDYLYYVTGDDGTNHFTETAAEHEAAVRRYCTIACAPGYRAPEVE